MRPWDVAYLALRQFATRKLRAWLTIFGIVIGVTAVIGLLAMGEGAQRQIDGQLAAFGGDTFTITPGFTQAQGGGGGFPGGASRFQGGGGPGAGASAAADDEPTLDDGDVATILAIDGVRAAYGMQEERLNVTWRAASATLQVRAVDPDGWAEITDETVQEGRLLSSTDRDAVVIGANVAEGLFDDPIQVNQRITINGQLLRVIGILAPAQGLGGSGNVLYAPLDAARSLLDADQDLHFDQIVAAVDPGRDVAEVAATAESVLMQARNLDEDEQDFTVANDGDVQSRIGDITSSVTGFVGAVAALSLIVGAVGIVNTMFMAVMERARQIGLMKALGARPRDIAGLFVAESGLMGLLGGFIGLGFGYGLSWAISGAGVSLLQLGPTSSFDLVITLPVAVCSVLGAAVIGAVAGLLPALQAARLEPAETLRIE